MFKYAGFWAAAAALLLAGCSPDYNWREVSVADGVIRAIFPDRPVSDERAFNVAGQEITFTLTTARVGDALFAVGHAIFPAALREDESARQQIGRVAIESLYQNLGAPVPAELPRFGDSFAIEGQSPQGPLMLRAKTWLTPYVLVEGIVTAPPDSFPGREAAEFLDAMRVAR